MATRLTSLETLILCTLPGLQQLSRNPAASPAPAGSSTRAQAGPAAKRPLQPGWQHGRAGCSQPQGRVCPWGPWPRLLGWGSSGLLGQPEQGLCPKDAALLGQSPGGCGTPGRRSRWPCPWPGRVLRGAGMKCCRSCQDALYQITLPFSLRWHICSHCGHLPSAQVVMKSLYLHKVIVHVIKEKKLY